jgi:histidinol-phosphate aminotransferase
MRRITQNRELQGMERLTPRAGIHQITPFRPARLTEEGRPAIDLSLSHNALGPSAKAVTAYRQMAQQLHHYPDTDHRMLRQAIARRYDLDHIRITCSNGSDEMIQLIAQAYAGPGDEVLFHQYGYRGFQRAVKASGATPVVAGERDLVVDVKALVELAGDRTRIVFLANPGNPTGSYISNEEVCHLRAELPAHTLLVIDAAYADYVRRNNYDAGYGLVDEHDNVLMVRTFSKLHGLAGLRIGWAYGPTSIIETINRIRPPFNVGLSAQAAAAAAIGDTDHEQATLVHNDAWLAWLTHELEALGIRVYPSVCNFLLVRIPPDPALGVGAVIDHLAGHAILVKSLVEYGLPDCLRITIGTEDENRALVEALAEILN